jgi:hypothetical protein
MTPDAGANHDISLAVWDLPSPAIVGRRTVLKVGLSCPSGCSLAAAAIEIRDESGVAIGSGRTGSEPWPATHALYWVEIDAATPETEGSHAWVLRATTHDALHPPLESIVRLVAAKPPEHRVTIDVIEQGSGRPLGDVELRVGPFRSTTNEIGRAHVAVPGGTYDVHAWKLGYDLQSTTAQITGDTAIQLEVAVTPTAEQPYWM